MYKIMTPGPTQVRENVRLARSRETTNPDLDPAFYDYYRETCEMLSQLLHTKNQALLLSGEGILGLEAACASLTEPGDRVLVIDNGVFGNGFADFVRIYGGEPVLFQSDYRNPVKPEELRAFLEKDSGFKYATVVHCDTPSGVKNDVESIGRLLNEFGILSVVDSVAGMFGEPLDADAGKIDILCGGSQKALSAPVGITLVWVSGRAYEAMEKRRSPIASFYANLLNIKDYYEKQEFPYSMPASDICGIRQAVENVLAEPGIYRRHAEIAAATRKAVAEAGLSLYLESGWANTVTAIEVPKGLSDTAILSHIRDVYGVMLAGSFGVFGGKLLRIGHMGENARASLMLETLDALQRTLADLGSPVKADMGRSFLEGLKG